MLTYYRSTSYNIATRVPWVLNRSNPAYNQDTADQPDFSTFLKDRPALLEEIRTKLRKGQRVGSWLYEELDDWRKSIPD